MRKNITTWVILGIGVLIIIGVSFFGGKKWAEHLQPLPLEPQPNPMVDSILAINRELTDSLAKVIERGHQASAVRKVYLDRYDTIYIHTDTTTLLLSLRTIANLQPVNR